MIGTTDIIALHMFSILDDIRRRVLGKVGAHVGTIGFDHESMAGFATVDNHVLAEEAHAHRGLCCIFGHSDHEPAARVGKFTQLVICRCCHDPLRFCDYQFSQSGEGLPPQNGNGKRFALNDA